MNIAFPVGDVDQPAVGQGRRQLGAAAAFPGLSRSGSTTATALACGLLNPAVAQTPLKIGFIATMSGPGGALGQDNEAFYQGELDTITPPKKAKRVLPTGPTAKQVWKDTRARQGAYAKGGCR